MAWYGIPSTFLLAQEVASSLTDSTASDLWAQLKLKTLPDAFCLRGNWTEAFFHSLSGPTSPPSGATTPTAPATSPDLPVYRMNLSFVAGFPVKTFPRPGAAPASPANAQGFGQRCAGSLATYDPHSRTWRTAQQSLLEDWNESLVTWPKSGMTRNMAFYQRPTLAQDTCANDGGALPSGRNIDLGVMVQLLPQPDGETFFHAPNTSGLDGGSNSRNALVKRRLTFATPTTMDALPPKSETALLREMTVARPGRSKPANLRDQVSNGDNWPTPNQRGFYNDGDLLSLAKACGSYAEYAAMSYRAGNKKKAFWPTPSANEPGVNADRLVDKDGNVPSHFNQRLYDKQTGRLAQKGLTQTVQMWPTPKAQEPGMSAKCSDRHFSKSTHMTMQVALAEDMIDPESGGLGRFPTPCSTMSKGSSEAALTRKDGKDRTNDRLDHFVGDTAAARLNPDWVEWLMLWPVGWSALEPLTTFAAYDLLPKDEPEGLPRVTTDCPNRAARIKAIGNGQVPLCAAKALDLLLSRFSR